MNGEQVSVPAIGIDLGTTNSLISIWQDGKAHLIPNSLGEYLTPSAISIDEDDSILIGRPALSRLTTHPSKTAALFKRYMGSNKQFKLGEKTFSAPELSALVLKSLKADAEAWTGQAIKDVVISVPAYFSDEQRKQTRFAAELAGLNAVRLINEPTAAAMAYGLHTQEFGRTLVFDLGGGTFDVTVLEYALPLIEVHSSAGDNYLGGEDFTHALVKACLKEWKLDEGTITPEAMARLNDAAEEIKCRLSAQESELSWHWQDKEWCYSLDDRQAEKLWLPLINRLRAPIEQALSDARLQPQELDHLVLVGGASRLGVIQRMVVRLFGKMPHQHLDPSTIVALGAAVQAACRLRDEDIDEVILTDVCPYTLGIATGNGKVSGIFSPIIERNTVVPTSRVETFYTNHPEQKFIRVAVYQGESPRVDSNILVEEFEVPVEPNGQIQALDIRFSYDINGLLEVDVNLLESGSSYSKVIDHSPIGLSEAQKQASHDRLKSLKIHPRDTMPNRALMARLERAWSQSLGDERLQIGIWLQEFDETLAAHKEELINEVRERLVDYLDSMKL
ncbi:Hsc62 [Pragia fontium]|uniref:Molecular chaperone HscC n=2 Tax=Pragia fontium TaxID=82985 RepID=A0AAJ4WDH1_9GAMM|nr:molecular chaperone HscC [Pragia fontium]AKJ40743.1 molecular chaperone HscC [Pragia fontium]GKX63691.1 molecular chaperone HscC [Pragia fontium]SFD40094.1 molecular chaperone HscC [Pragia fontium DSM 5563 = ATCC 49100]SUB80909.1 Hsc62 [Pragia fontium]